MQQKLKGEALNKIISDYLLGNGAVSVGFATKETLQDSPPSADITYLMQNGLSAVAFVVPWHKGGIRPYLAKQDHGALFRPGPGAGVGRGEARLRDDVAEILRKEGHSVVTPETNMRYRTEIENWRSFMPPDISHRYLAVASGAGSFGWSGNVGVKGYGSAIRLATVLTDAELQPTDPLPEEQSFCANCKACARACPMEMFSETEKMSLTLGGREYSYSARIDILRCGICCGDQTGLHRSRKWSSWNPGRFEVPEDKNGLRALTGRMGPARAKWPPREGERTQTFGEGSKTENKNTSQFRFVPSCMFCSLVCTGDKKENLENLKLILNSGCVIQYPDGSLKVLPPDKAEEEFNRMPPEHRALYC